jgi:hypothetical protein
VIVNSSVPNRSTVRAEHVARPDRDRGRQAPGQHDLAGPQAAAVRGQRADQPRHRGRGVTEHRGAGRGGHHLAVALEDHAHQAQVDAGRRHRGADHEPAGRGVVGDHVGCGEPVVAVSGVDDLDSDRDPGRRREHVGGCHMRAGQVGAEDEDDLRLGARLDQLGGA